jgi:hypothetical protein
MDARLIDYRLETPSVCPNGDCGAAVRVTGEKRGNVNISGPADRAWAARYGLEGDGPAETIWNTWECEAGHEGPVLLA